MARVQCTVCHGIYTDTLPDGLRYFHQCPPLVGAELAAALAAGTVQLARREKARLDAARASDLLEPVKAGELTREQQVLQSLAMPRPGARDENIDPTKAADARATLGRRADDVDPVTLQRAPGTGVIALPADDTL